MKIDDSIKKTDRAGVGPIQAKPGKAAAKTDGASPPASDSVQLSSQARALAAQNSSTGVMDVAKIEEIKAAIANGTFKVDPENVANGLLDTVNDLLRSRK